jgi:hypothetical protein
VKKAPSHPYACGELQHGFALSTVVLAGGLVRSAAAWGGATAGQGAATPGGVATTVGWLAT